MLQLATTRSALKGYDKRKPRKGMATHLQHPDFSRNSSPMALTDIMRDMKWDRFIHVVSPQVIWMTYSDSRSHQKSSRHEWIWCISRACCSSEEHEEQPFTLGVRLDVDFDGFFRREDASAQLKLWREARTEGLSSGCWAKGLEYVFRCL